MRFRPHWITLPRMDQQLRTACPPGRAQRPPRTAAAPAPTPGATLIGPGALLTENGNSSNHRSAEQGGMAPLVENDTTQGLERIQRGVVRIHSYGRGYSFLTPHQKAPPQQKAGPKKAAPSTPPAAMPRMLLRHELEAMPPKKLVEKVLELQSELKAWHEL